MLSVKFIDLDFKITNYLLSWGVVAAISRWLTYSKPCGPIIFLGCTNKFLAAASRYTGWFWNNVLLSKGISSCNTPFSTNTIVICEARNYWHSMNTSTKNFTFAPTQITSALCCAVVMATETIKWKILVIRSFCEPAIETYKKVLYYAHGSLTLITSLVLYGESEMYSTIWSKIARHKLSLE